MTELSKRTRLVLIVGLALILMIGTIPLAIWVTHTTSAQVGNELARCSSTMQPIHKVIIKANIAIPNHVAALQCDSLEFINDGNRIELIAFGPHEHHVSYDGVSEHVLLPGQSFSVKLVQVGAFNFHDHSTDAAQGTFVVSK